jgi:hypothetical protein
MMRRKMSVKKSLPTKRKQTTVPDYETFLRSLTLAGFGLETCSAELDRGAYFDLDSKNRKKEIAGDYGLMDSEDDFFNLFAKFELAIGDKKTASSALRVRCEFVAHFHLDIKLKKEFVERFAQSEFRLLVWPYFRQFIADLSGRMSLPPVTIPLQSPE